MNEALLQAIWQQRLFAHQGLRTACGKAVQVLSPGLLNRDPGPDFSCARLVIDNTEHVGAVEIHTCASHWRQHNHQTDPAYDAVVLHVVLYNDEDVHTSSGRTLPVLELHPHIAPETLARAGQLSLDMPRPCAAVAPSLPATLRAGALDSAGAERLAAKSVRVQTLIDELNGDLQQAYFTLLAVYFLGKQNAQPARALADRLPVVLLARYSTQMAFEALLLGTAGLLEDILQGEKTTEQAAYEEALVAEWAFLRTKHALEPLDGGLWMLGRMRPAALPAHRLAQLAAWVLAGLHLFEPSLPRIDALLQVSARPSAYWDTHYRLGLLAAAHNPDPGRETRYGLLINVHAPMLHAYGTVKRDMDAVEASLALMELLPPERNRVTAALGLVLGQAQNALQGQGMLHLDGMLCTPRLCMQCRIGQATLRGAGVIG